jgi:inosine-uridine nucleoside N-ribohydrolase
VKRPVALLWLATALRAAQPVWIDTDPSVERGGHEIDDGFALVEAFRSPELAIRGVSIVFGNAPLAEADAIGRDIVKRFGPPGMPVFTGASSKAGLGKETEASRALAAALESEKLVVLALGPATNVATILKLHPELRRRIVRIIAVAGRRPGQRFTAGSGTRSLRDFNFEMDPDAFQVILDARVPLVLAPWEISSKVWLTKSDLDALRPGNAAIEYLYEPSMDWLALWKRDFGADGFNPFDTLAVGYLTARREYKCRLLPAAIRTLADDTGAGGVKPYLLASDDLPPRFKVEYCSQAGPGFRKQLLERLH